MKKPQNIYFVFLAVIVVVILFVIYNMYVSTHYSDKEQSNITNIDTVDEPVLSEWQKAINLLDASSTREDIKKIQDEYGPDIVFDINCSIFTQLDDLGYCEQEKQYAREFVNRISWYAVSQTGYEYAKNFDCEQLYLESEQKICLEFQQTTNN